MLPLKNPIGIEAARRAAEVTRQSEQEKAEQEQENDGFGTVLQLVLLLFALPFRFVMKLFPWYRRLRAYAKVQVTQLLYGDSRYACRFRLTGINILVLCSFTFLFIENVRLAFLPVSWDMAAAIVAA